MSTLAEIQEAIARLPTQEKQALSVWLNSQMESALDSQEEEALIRSLDEAKSDLAQGKGMPIEDVRKLVASWAGR